MNADYHSREWAEAICSEFAAVRESWAVRGSRAPLWNKGRSQCACRGCGPGELGQLTSSGVSWGWVRGYIWLSLVGSKLEAGKKEKEASVIDQVLWLGADEFLFGCLDYGER